MNVNNGGRVQIHGSVHTEIEVNISDTYATTLSPTSQINKSPEFKCSSEAETSAEHHATFCDNIENMFGQNPSKVFCYEGLDKDTKQSSALPCSRDI